MTLCFEMSPLFTTMLESLMNGGSPGARRCCFAWPGRWQWYRRLTALVLKERCSKTAKDPEQNGNSGDVSPRFFSLKNTITLSAEVASAMLSPQRDRSRVWRPWTDAVRRGRHDYRAICGTDSLISTHQGAVWYTARAVMISRANAEDCATSPDECILQLERWDRPAR